MSQFDTETVVTKIHDTLWRGHISAAWNIGDNPNGGYLLSVALRALQSALPHPDPISVTTHYLRPGSPNQPCDIQVEILRTGKTLSTARATLIQGDKARLELLAVFGDLSQSVGIDTEITIAAPKIPEPEDCTVRDGDRQGIALPIADRLDTRLDPASAIPGKSTKAELNGWNRFQDLRAPDSICVPLFCDTFPPSPFALLGNVGWVPTIELTVHVRRRPQPGWLQARFSCDDLSQGRMIETGQLWDSGGHLVAQSRQIGLVMNAS
jgi:acyl-CoA thioesterase